jgi:hypothetical protein
VHHSKLAESRKGTTNTNESRQLDRKFISNFFFPFIINFSYIKYIWNLFRIYSSNMLTLFIGWYTTVMERHAALETHLEDVPLPRQAPSKTVLSLRPSGSAEQVKQVKVDLPLKSDGNVRYIRTYSEYIQDSVNKIIGEPHRSASRGRRQV